MMMTRTRGRFSARLRYLCLIMILAGVDHGVDGGLP